MKNAALENGSEKKKSIDERGERKHSFLQRSPWGINIIKTLVSGSAELQ